MDGVVELVGEQAWCEVGAELRRLRTDRGMTLPGLARQVNYTKGYLSKIETGKKRLTPEMARLLDEALRTGGELVGLLASPERLVPGDDDPDLAGTAVCPYPGLVAFGLPEARWFFGRDQATSDVIGQLEARLAGDGLLAVVAPSGAGKSSLLAAGLIPALAGGALLDSRAWPVVRTTPGGHPLSALAAGVAELTGTDPAEAAAATADPERFAAFLTRTVTDHGGKPGETSSPAWVVLIVDQFEEIFTECQRESERLAFITALCTAAQSAAVLVVLGVRADFYGRCLAYPALLNALQTPVALGPMSAQQLREIITGPAETEGLQIEPGLVELLLRDLGITDHPGGNAPGYDPGALPLLAHALRATWQQRDGRLLTVAGYRRTGGIWQGIATTAERAYTRLSPPEQRIAQQLLLRLVKVDAHTGALRHRVSRERLHQALPTPIEATEKILETFARARLLTFDTNNVEITHEALLRSWPRLADWINADRAGLRIHQQLYEAADAWEADDRDPSLVYRGSRLVIAQDWATGPGRKAQLSALEQAYLQASIEQKHHEQRAQRRGTRLRAMVGVLAISLVMALLAGMIARRDYYKAIAAQLAATANSEAAKHPDAAMLLAVEAYHLAQTSGTRGALLSAQSQYLAGQLTDPTGLIITKAVFSPDGHTLATVTVTSSAGSLVRLWDVASHNIITTIKGPGYDAEFSPDGHTLAIARGDWTVGMWNVADPHNPSPLVPVSGVPGTKFSAATFSHDGRILATVSGDGSARLWNAASRQQIATLTGHPSPITKVVFSADGRILATVSGDGSARLWDVADPGQPTPLDPPLTGHTGSVNAVVFSPDGDIMATGSGDGTVRLWNVATHQQIATLMTDHTGSVNAVVFSHDGRILATGSKDGTARLWDIATHQTVGTFGRHNGPISSVAFSEDGHTVATAGGDGIVRLWDANGRIFIPSSATIGHDVEFSLDGRVLATAGEDGTVWLWNMAHPTQPTPLAGHTGPITKVVFSHDGRILTTVSRDGSARLWNVATHQQIATLMTGHTGSVNAVAFSPDGHTLATTNDDGTARLWNVTDPTHPTSLGPPLGTLVMPSRTGDVLANPVVFSHNGDTLATVSDDGTARLWNVTDPAHPTHLGPPLGTPLTSQTIGVINITKVLFSQNDRILVTASNDGTVQRWEADTGHLTTTRTISTIPGEPFSPVAFSSDGHILATTSGDDNTTNLWDVDKENPLLIATLTGHTGPINAAAFSQDGGFLATVSNDTTVRLWDLKPDRVTNHLCNIIGKPSPEEWKRYLPVMSYQPTCP